MEKACEMLMDTIYLLRYEYAETGIAHLMNIWRVPKLITGFPHVQG